MLQLDESKTHSKKLGDANAGLKVMGNFTENYNSTAHFKHNELGSNKNCSGGQDGQFTKDGDPKNCYYFMA